MRVLFFVIYALYIKKANTIMRTNKLVFNEETVNLKMIENKNYFYDANSRKMSSRDKDIITLKDDYQITSIKKLTK